MAKRATVWLSSTVMIFIVTFGLLLVVRTTFWRQLLKRSVAGEQTENDDTGDFIIENISPDNIRSNLRYLTKKPHLGGTPAELETANWVAETWRSQGFDEVHLVPYHVLLSYPRDDIPNLVRLLDSKGNVIWESDGRQKPLYAPEEFLPDVPFTFNAYSAPGNVTGDRVVYANYGRFDDFEFLAESRINVSGCIVIARYGKIFRANIARLAEDHGAVGVIFFSDPQDYAPYGYESVYPHNGMMPPSAAAEGTVKLVDGDPLTPFYPAIESAFHIPVEESSLPTIPVQAISYENAWHILSSIGGEEAPADWQGGLNFTYHLGPALTDSEMMVNMEVYTHNVPTVTYDVIGVIKGSEEPDRYVIVGNHRDAWIFGGFDPSSGTAAMMELSRVFMQLHEETGWRPRRTVIFCSWGSEEYGLVGSVEWTQQFAKQLGDRAVAYLNIDQAMNGNYTFRVKSSPLLYELVWNSAKKVPNPDPDEVAAGRPTVYDTWVYRRPDYERPGYPWMHLISSGSDFKGFQNNIGVPCNDMRYTYGNVTIGQPLYHTLYETFALVDEIHDKGFLFHAAVTAVWGDMAITLADSKILPFSLDEYSRFITIAQEEMIETYGELIASQNITLEYFTAAAENFSTAIADFKASLDNIDMTNPLAVRRANDQQMMVERAFIDSQGLPDRPELNHVVVAPSAHNTYGGTVFAGLNDALAAISRGGTNEELNALWRQFAQHLSAVTHLLETAGKVLSDDMW